MLNVCCASCQHNNIEYKNGRIKRVCKKSRPIGRVCSFYIIANFFRERGYKLIEISKE